MTARLGFLALGICGLIAGCAGTAQEYRLVRAGGDPQGHEADRGGGDADRIRQLHPNPDRELTPHLEEVFLENLPLLKRVIGFTCRRRGANADEAEEFEAWLMARMVESGGASARPALAKPEPEPAAIPPARARRRAPVFRKGDDR